MSGEVDYRLNALSQNTRRSYASDLTCFTAWGALIPADDTTVARYLSEKASTLTIATLRRRLASVSKHHTEYGFADPVKSEVVKSTMRGIARMHGKPQQRVAPLLKDDIVLICSRLGSEPRSARDKALLLLGFCAALRRSELVAAAIEHLAFNNQGIVLTIPRSKTDQYGEGRKVGIPYGRGRICPVMAVSDWIVHLSANSGPLFRSITKGGVVSAEPLSDRSVASILKGHASLLGIDPNTISGHSLRAGLATSAAQNGISSLKIRAQTGHQSDAMLMRYIRDGDLFNNNAAALF